MFSCQFYEKWLPVRERNIKLLLESVICIAIAETVTLILQEKQLCTAESTTYIVATEIPTCINTIKIVTQIFDAETVTCINAAKTSNSIIATETVTCMIITERSTNITITESTICKVAIEPQNLQIALDVVTCIIAIESVSYMVPTETSTCRINYIQKLSLAEMVSVRDSFSYNKEIEQMSKHQV